MFLRAGHERQRAEKSTTQRSMVVVRRCVAMVVVEGRWCDVSISRPKKTVLLTLQTTHTPKTNEPLTPQISHHTPIPEMPTSPRGLGPLGAFANFNMLLTEESHRLDSMEYSERVKRKIDPTSLLMCLRIGKQGKKLLYNISIQSHLGALNQQYIRIHVSRVDVHGIVRFGTGREFMDSQDPIAENFQSACLQRIVQEIMDDIDRYLTLLPLSLEFDSSGLGRSL